MARVVTIDVTMNGDDPPDTDEGTAPVDFTMQEDTGGA